MGQVDGKLAAQCRDSDAMLHRLLAGVAAARTHYCGELSFRYVAFTSRSSSAGWQQLPAVGPERGRLLPEADPESRRTKAI